MGPIALVGTTSCGKSTLGNALVGRWVLPAGVQETTRAPTEVRHTWARACRRVHTSTHESSPTSCRTDGELRRYVAELHATEVASLQIDLCCARGVGLWAPWPGVGALRDWLASPNVTEPFLVDLPGCNSAVDVARLEVTSAQVKEAGLVVYAFGAEQTDPRKESVLLDCVLGALGGADRVVFVLSQADVLHRDVDYNTSLSRVVAERRRLVMESAARLDVGCGEPEILPISPRAALAAEMLGPGAHWCAREERDAVFEWLREYSHMVRWSSDWPSSVRKWPVTVLDRFLRDLVAASGWVRLLRTLRLRRAMIVDTTAAVHGEPGVQASLGEVAAPRKREPLGRSVEAGAGRSQAT